MKTTKLPLIFFYAIIITGIFALIYNTNVKYFVEDNIRIPFITYTYAHSSSFDKTYKKVQQLHKQYTEEKDNGNIYASFPENEATDRYVNSFLHRLSMIQDTMNKKATQEINNQESQKISQQYDNEINNLVKTFQAGADFDEVKNYVFESGDVYSDMGINANNKHDISSETLNKEKQVREYEIQPAYDYREQAETIAKTFNMSIVYGLEKLPEGCANDDDKINEQYILGMVCSVDTSVIYVNSGSVAEQQFDDPAFISSIKHEIAHHLIEQRCGTLIPEVSGEYNEGVTSSYAVLFLSADRDHLQASSKDFPAYTMNDNTDNIARIIHNEGICTL